jgi:hypothetical protein
VHAPPSERVPRSGQPAAVGIADDIVSEDLLKGCQISDLSSGSECFKKSVLLDWHRPADDVRRSRAFGHG